jgi:TolB protein
MKYLLIALCLWTTAVHAQEGGDNGLYIKVSDANVKKSLVAMPNFQFFGSPASIKNYQTVGSDIYNTVLNDLDVSSYFQFIRKEAFLEDASKTGLKPIPQAPNGFRFDSWKQIKAEFLIRAGFNVVGDKVELEAYLYHVPREKVILAKKYSGSLSNVREIAHTFANDIILNLTGKKGMFLSKIVAVSDRAGNKWKEIYLMDWDGKNMEKITSHRSISISPAWSPDGKSITYTAFALHKKEKTRNADLFLYELGGEKRFLLSSRKGINSGSTFSPDGKWVYLTISQNGNPDIYRVDLDGENMTRITNGPGTAMNVEPDVSPDASRIAFSSDRSGKPMIYTMSASGGDVKRLTYAGDYNSTPSWSPDGKKLAFAGFDKGHFDLFVMDADGTNMIRLTDARRANGRAANNENPSFSPDGRHIVFVSDRSGSRQIYIVNADGTNERRITFDSSNYDQPKWGRKY